MQDVALITWLYNRPKKADFLMQSVRDTLVNKVYIADTGPELEGKERIYNREYPFDVEIYNFDNPTGIAHSGKRIIEDISEEYFIQVPSDYTLPQNVGDLVNVLEKKENLAGVGVLKADIHENRVFSCAADLHEVDGKLIREIQDKKEIELVAAKPFIPFDYNTFAGMFRRKAFNDYNYDESLDMGREHVDIYLGLKKSGWEFGTCPSVVFTHNHEENKEYSERRHNLQEEQTEYFLKKWGYNDIVVRDKWLDTSRKPGITDFLEDKYYQSGMNNLTIIDKVVNKII
jgi:GT2 family glycosyltransferase